MFLLFGGSGYRPLLGNILYCVELNGFEKNQEEISELKDFRRSDKNDRERIDNNMNVIYREMKELRDFIGIDAQKAQAEAEKAIEESVQ